MENQTIQEEPQIQRQTVSFPQAPKPKKKVGIKLLILVTLLALIGGIAWFLLSNENPFSGEVAISPTPTTMQNLPSPTPVPTEVPVSKSELQVLVQNGTGIPGEAAYLETQMKQLGFENVDTGNADSKTNTTTQVSFASRVPEEVQTEVTAKLQELYSTVDVASTTSAGIDIQVTTGTRKGAKSTATPTVTPRSSSASSTPTPTKSTSVTTTTTITPTKNPTP